MDMVQIVTTPDEVNASIIIGFLKNIGIHATYANHVTRHGQIASCTVYAPKEKSQEALKVLKEQGLIKS